MALLQMQRIYIYALNKDRKKILDLLQRREVVEVRSMLKEDSVFRRTEESLSVQDF
jgi:V/A-type H+-transporting ATPase subunit I